MILDEGVLVNIYNMLYGMKGSFHKTVGDSTKNQTKGIVSMKKIIAKLLVFASVVALAYFSVFELAGAREVTLESVRVAKLEELSRCLDKFSFEFESRLYCRAKGDLEIKAIQSAIRKFESKYYVTKSSFVNGSPYAVMLDKSFQQNVYEVRGMYIIQSLLDSRPSHIRVETTLSLLDALEVDDPTMRYPEWFVDAVANGHAKFKEGILSLLNPYDLLFWTKHIGSVEDVKIPSALLHVTDGCYK